MARQAKVTKPEKPTKETILKAEIKHLKKELDDTKEELTVAKAHAAAYEASCNEAFAKARKADNQIDELLTKFNRDMSYVSQLTAAFAESVLRVTKGE